MMVDIELPMEPFYAMVKDGTAGAAIQKLLADIKPEAIYFRERQRLRGCTMIVEMTEMAQMPATAEPVFLRFTAMVNSNRS